MGWRQPGRTSGPSRLMLQHQGSRSGPQGRGRSTSAFWDQRVRWVPVLPGPAEIWTPAEPVPRTGPGSFGAEPINGQRHFSFYSSNTTRSMFCCVPASCACACARGCSEPRWQLRGSGKTSRNHPEPSYSHPELKRYPNVGCHNNTSEIRAAVSQVARARVPSHGHVTRET